MAAEGDEDEGRCGGRRRRRRPWRRKEKAGAAVVRGEKERRWWFGDVREEDKLKRGDSSGVV